MKEREMLLITDKTVKELVKEIESVDYNDVCIIDHCFNYIRLNISDKKLLIMIERQYMSNMRGYLFDKVILQKEVDQETLHLLEYSTRYSKLENTVVFSNDFVKEVMEE